VIFLLRILLAPLALVLGSLPDRWFVHPERERQRILALVEAVGLTFMVFPDGTCQRLEDAAREAGLI
jgi:hypothetical protein